MATILVFELALLLSIKRDRMTMAAIGGLAGFNGLMILFHAGPLRLTKRAKNTLAFVLGGALLAVYIIRLAMHAIP